jgi:charged multivesicular body protein 4A/B
LDAAAKAALRRKKQFEHSLEQTSSQIMTLEREIYSIETANINKETLDAMKNAGSAMKQIHAGLTIDKVDNVMYGIIFSFRLAWHSRNSLLMYIQL